MVGLQMPLPSTYPGPVMTVTPQPCEVTRNSITSQNESLLAPQGSFAALTWHASGYMSNVTLCKAKTRELRPLYATVVLGVPGHFGRLPCQPVFNDLIRLWTPGE